MSSAKNKHLFLIIFLAILIVFSIFLFSKKVYAGCCTSSSFFSCGEQICEVNATDWSCGVLQRTVIDCPPTKKPRIDFISTCNGEGWACPTSGINYYCSCDLSCPGAECIIGANCPDHCSADPNWSHTYCNEECNSDCKCYVPSGGCTCVAGYCGANCTGPAANLACTSGNTCYYSQCGYLSDPNKPSCSSYCSGSVSYYNGTTTCSSSTGWTNCTYSQVNCGTSYYEYQTVCSGRYVLYQQRLISKGCSGGSCYTSTGSWTTYSQTDCGTSYYEYQQVCSGRYVLYQQRLVTKGCSGSSCYTSYGSWTTYSQTDCGTSFYEYQQTCSTDGRYILYQQRLVTKGCSGSSCYTSYGSWTTYSQTDCGTSFYEYQQTCSTDGRYILYQQRLVTKGCSGGSCSTSTGSWTTYSQTDCGTSFYEYQQTCSTDGRYILYQQRLVTKGCSGSSCYTSYGSWTTYSQTDCNSSDRCEGTTYRDYYCSGGFCAYTSSYNDSRCITCTDDCAVLGQTYYQCSGTMRQSRLCGSFDADSCNDWYSDWVNVEDCNSYDRCEGTTYRDYYCSGGSCAYTSSYNDARCVVPTICGDGTVDLGEDCDPPGSTSFSSCGSGACTGTRIRTCQSDCTWGNWGNCSTEGNSCGENCNPGCLDKCCTMYCNALGSCGSCTYPTCDCTCGGWTTQSCGYSTCGLYEKGQTRTCNPPGCLNELNCFCDQSCCTSWVDQDCGLGGCDSTLMYQTRDCGTCSFLETQCVSDASCGNISCSLNRQGNYTIDYFCDLYGYHYLQSGNLTINNGTIQMNENSTFVFDSGYQINIGDNAYILKSVTSTEIRKE